MMLRVKVLLNERLIQLNVITTVVTQKKKKNEREKCEGGE